MELTVIEFIIPFSSALLKLKAAKEDNLGVSLTSDEVKAVVTGLLVLRKGDTDA